MLKTAVHVWGRSVPRPVIVLAARAGSPSSRRLARRMAAAAGMKFLFVEARSHPIQAYARLSAMGLPEDDLTKRLKLYDQALKQCVPVGRDEVTTLPALRLKRVLSDIDGAALTVLTRWSRS